MILHSVCDNTNEKRERSKLSWEEWKISSVTSGAEQMESYFAKTHRIQNESMESLFAISLLLLFVLSFCAVVWSDWYWRRFDRDVHHVPQCVRIGGDFTLDSPIYLVYRFEIICVSPLECDMLKVFITKWKQSVQTIVIRFRKKFTSITIMIVTIHKWHRISSMIELTGHVPK